MWPFSKKKQNVVQQTEVLVDCWYFNFDNMSARLDPEEPIFHDQMVTVRLLAIENDKVCKLETVRKRLIGAQSFFANKDKQKILDAAYQNWIDKTLEQAIGLTFED
jgi:hypothetical protein